MLKIRLSRIGKKHQPHYRIVVTEARRKRGGRSVAQIGHYFPEKNKFAIDKKEYEGWIGKGAVPTEAVRKLVNEKTS